MGGDEPSALARSAIVVRRSHGQVLTGRSLGLLAPGPDRAHHVGRHRGSAGERGAGLVDLADQIVGVGQAVPLPHERA